jgi:hypothetical protein
VELWQDGVRMDVVFMLLIVIGGAANLTAFLLNMHLQGVAVKPVVFSSIIVGIALVDMYSNCSDVHSTSEVFERIPICNLISWTTIFVGEAQHGRVEEVLSL